MWVLQLSAPSDLRIFAGRSSARLAAVDAITYLPTCITMLECAPLTSRLPMGPGDGLTRPDGIKRSVYIPSIQSGLQAKRAHIFLLLQKCIFIFSVSLFYQQRGKHEKW